MNSECISQRAEETLHNIRCWKNNNNRQKFPTFNSKSVNFYIKDCFFKFVSIFAGKIID